jgi:hypothetical protein
MVAIKSIDPAVQTDTITGDEGDCFGTDRSVVVLVNAGALVGVDASNYFEFTVKQATALGGSYVDAEAWQYDPVAVDGGSTAWDMKIDDAGEANEIYKFNFKLKGDYGALEVVGTKNGTPTSALFGACILFVPRTQPATAA